MMGLAHRTFTKEYAGEAVHCCLMMDMALGEGYLGQGIGLNFDAGTVSVTPPYLNGVPLTKTGKKTKPNIYIDYCPFCGKQLTIEARS